MNTGAFYCSNGLCPNAEPLTPLGDPAFSAARCPRCHARMEPEVLESVEAALSIKRVAAFAETHEDTFTDAEQIKALLVNNGILLDVCRAILDQEKRLRALEEA